MNQLKKFIELNQNISRKIEKMLPHAKPDITDKYSQIVSEYANKQKNQVIVDLGGGRSSPFVKYLNKKLKNQLIVVDEDESELEKNISANKTLVADINKPLPLKPQSVDLVVSRYVLEHLEGVPNFIINSKKILKDGGYSINLFSCKFAIFSILNQLIPSKLAKILLNNLIPGSQHIRGFKTNYNYCFYDSIINIYLKNGFTVEKIKLSYYQSRYFSFFLPFYIVSIIYELILYTLGLKNLCAYILIIARKNGD
ncbi:MAG: methyltransferase domain-containing protein [Microgenomates group bacterium]|jgi:ubiquinone/menaquinone biosynthesis C-methylase UbiE